MFRFANSIFTPIVLGVLGASVGVLIILIPFDKGSAVKETPAFLLWTFLNCAILAVVAIIIGPLLVSVIQLLKKYFAGNGVMIIISLVFVTGSLFIIPIISNFYLKDNIPQQLLEFGMEIKTTLLSVITPLFVGLPVFTGILLIQSAVKDKLRKIIKGDEDNIQWFLKKRALLQNFLLIAGSVLGLAILATGALSKLFVAFEGEFSPDIVLAYGAYLTLILAIIYIPAHYSLIALGNCLRDMECHLPSPSSDSWMEKISKRKSIEELLQLRIGAGQNIRSNIAIVAPLISGIISKLIW